MVIASIGLQTGSDRVNKEIYKRKVTGSEFLAATKLVKDAGLYGYYDIILDNPYETKEDILKTLEIILQIRKPFQFQLFSLCLYSGTELHEKARNDGISFVDPRLDDNEAFSSNIFNKLIRMTPNVSSSIVKYLVKNRVNILVVIIINLIDFLNKLFFTPFFSLQLLHYSYGSNLNMTFRLIRAFGKTAIGKMINRTK